MLCLMDLVKNTEITHTALHLFLHYREHPDGEYLHLV